MQRDGDYPVHVRKLVGRRQPLSQHPAEIPAGLHAALVLEVPRDTAVLRLGVVEKKRRSVRIPLQRPVRRQRPLECVVVLVRHRIVRTLPEVRERQVRHARKAEETLPQCQMAVAHNASARHRQIKQCCADICQFYVLEGSVQALAIHCTTAVYNLTADIR